MGPEIKGFKEETMLHKEGEETKGPKPPSNKA